MINTSRSDISELKRTMAQLEKDMRGNEAKADGAEVTLEAPKVPEPRDTLEV